MEADFLVSGHRAGRIQPTGWVSPSSWCYLLGSDSPLVIGGLSIGQNHYITQSGVDLTSAIALGFAFRFRQTTTAEAVSGLRIDAVGYIDAIEVWRRTVTTGDVEQFVRRWIPCGNITGAPVDIKFGLEVTAAP
jgi:hypothetical protein